MDIKDLKSFAELFTEVKYLRDKEYKMYIQRELETDYTIEEQIKKENDLLISKARQSAFQEVIDLMMEKTNEKILDTNDTNG